MKKTYSKPDIVFESFSLSTSVASNCLIYAPSQPSGIGAIQAGMFTVFQNSTQGCIVQVTTGVWEGFCYHNPSDFNNLFNS